MLVSEEQGEFTLAHQQPCRVIRVTSAPRHSQKPRDAELQLRFVTSCKGQRVPDSGSQPDPKWGSPRGRAHQHPQGVPPKTQLICGAEQSPQAHPNFIQQTFVSKPSAASPGARACLGGLILLSLALVSAISSLGFSGISHYLPYCERSSNTEEVFSFPLELLSWTLSRSQAELSISSPESSPLRVGNLEMLKVRRFKVHWQSSISPACIILGAGQCYQSLAKKE